MRYRIFSVSIFIAMIFVGCSVSNAKEANIALPTIMCGMCETNITNAVSDMDGLIKIPTNVPNQANMSKFIGQPLTQVPDPFETHTSFGEHNNSRLRSFLDSFNFEYEFLSATECYKSGTFDKALIKVLDRYDEIKNTILTTLGEERRKTYSPFLPICQNSGKVLEV